jgi:hypothetical protein
MKKQIVTIKYSRPFFWRILKIFFPDYDPDGTVAVAFGRITYANIEIPEDYQVHESIHLRQHCYSYFVAVFWWILYLFSKRFRYSQELEAFREQYKWIIVNQPFWRRKKLDEYAHQLSSSLYGSMVSFEEARERIKERKVDNSHIL